MSLYTIVDDAMGDMIATPSSIVGNSDETAIKLLKAAKRAGESLARAAAGGWVNMIREYDFTTAAFVNQTGTVANTGSGGVAQITLPGGTGPIAANWQTVDWFVFGTGMPNNAIVFNVVGNVLTLNQAASVTGAGIFTFGQSDYPLPSDFQRPVDNTMWDRSRFWSMRGPLSPQQWQLFKSSVIGRASIQRRYRFRRINGPTGVLQVFSVDPCPTDNGAQLVFEYVSNAWCQSASGAPQTTWLADTDVGILDEYLLMLGTRWRALANLGMSYAEALSEYEREVSKAKAMDGALAILDLTPDDRLTLIGPWNLPETNFGNMAGS